MATLESVTMIRKILPFIGMSPITRPWRTRVPRSFLLRGLRTQESTKTDLTLGRSVALLAPPHPKCPFQVEHRRVRASLRCFLVLGY